MDYSIQVVNIEQYLINKTYQKRHLRYLLPIDIFHTIYTLPGPELRVFLIILARCVSDKLFTVSGAELAKIARVLSIKAHVLVKLEKKLEEKQLIIRLEKRREEKRREENNKEEKRKEKKKGEFVETTQKQGNTDDISQGLGKKAFKEVLAKFRGGVIDDEIPF